MLTLVSITSFLVFCYSVGQCVNYLMAYRDWPDDHALPVLAAVLLFNDALYIAACAFEYYTGYFSDLRALYDLSSAFINVIVVTILVRFHHVRK